MKQSTKDKVLKTPVIGHLAAFALLPRRLRELKQWEAEVTRLRDIDIRDLAERVEHCVRTEEQILRTEEQIAVAGDERWQATTETFHSLGKQMSDLREMADAERMAREESIRRTREDLDFSRGLNALMADGERLSALRTNLSIHPALWGPAERLHISPEASIGSCYLNTNSGEITVGEFTFAGPGVSLITGSHDARLRDFPRRDLSPQRGHDIVIGRGVWLCANTTVLGPCRIGDHAVIAAGAVVIPGTEVEAGAIYGGVPARKIGETGDMDPETERQAFSRFGGCLYTRGWYAAETVRNGDAELTGHWMIATEAEICMMPGAGVLHYISPLGADENRTLTVETAFGSHEIHPKAEGEIPIPDRSGEKNMTVRLCISSLTPPASPTDPRKLGLFIY